MKNTINDLKSRYALSNESEKKIIDLEMEKLALKDPIAFSESLLLLANETQNQAEELLLKQKLEDVLPIISVSYLSKIYFKKTPQWFYQRLNGNKINGKIAEFTAKEKMTLSKALEEISIKLSDSARVIAS